MRNLVDKRDARYADIPENLESDRVNGKLDEIFDNPMGYKVRDEYNHGDVRAALRRHYGIKCVYCESSPIASSTFRIDHYRPKKKIKEVDAHTGYYWLAFEWTNLMQSCQLCNGAKSNFFPLATEIYRVTDTTPTALDPNRRNPTTPPLVLEERLLLNPELDDVERHFAFSFDGTIHSKTAEGLQSIKTYDLQRDDLILARKSLRDEFFAEIREALIDYEEALIRIGSANSLHRLHGAVRGIFKRILLGYLNNFPFSLLYLSMFEHLDEFFVNHLKKNEHQHLLSDAFTLFKNSAL